MLQQRAGEATAMAKGSRSNYFVMVPPDECIFFHIHGWQTKMSCSFSLWRNGYLTDTWQPFTPLLYLVFKDKLCQFSWTLSSTGIPRSPLNKEYALEVSAIICLWLDFLLLDRTHVCDMPKGRYSRYWADQNVRTFSDERDPRRVLASCDSWSVNGFGFVYLDAKEIWYSEYMFEASCIQRTRCVSFSEPHFDRHWSG